MQRMQSCCIRGCDSYRQAASNNIGYFKFPLHDASLLKKWLGQMNRGTWRPSETSQICSAHFKEEDLKRSTDQKYPILLPASIPTIFPSKKGLGRKRRIDEEILEIKDNELNDSEIKIEDLEPHGNKVSLLIRKTDVSSIKLESKENPGVDSMSRNTLTKPNALNSAGIVSSDSSIGQNKPFLRITINKRLNIPTSSKPAPFETVFLPYHEGNETPSEIVEVGNEMCVSKTIRGESKMPNIRKDRSKQNLRQSSNKMKPKISPSPKTVYEDHIYSCPPTVRVQSFKSKARQESGQLRRRLEELRERRKREQLKIVRLQMHLVELEEKMKENNEEEIVMPDLGRGSKRAGAKSSWLIREKEEYEKLLKDVREIKLKVLRERHNQELLKIRRLQTQMTNLRKQMRENDEKEIALANFKEKDKSAVARPDWMQREEEEYEKLLQDVRRIKQSYKMQKEKKTDSLESDSTRVFKCEKVLSDEDCVLIETMQKNNKLMEEIEAGIELTDDNDEYGEVIGEIDEDSIDIDISKEVIMLNFSETLPDPGPLDS